MKNKSVILIGAGLAGSLLAIFLARRGFKVDIYERRPDMRTADISAGRSINLALSTRGIHALSQVGLFESLQGEIIPMKGRLIHPVDGDLNFQPYGKDDTEVINSVSRGGLNCRLMDAAEGYENVQLHFNQRCLDMNLDSGEVFLRNEQTGTTSTVSGSTVIATDGATSPVRLAMQKYGRFNLNQFYLDHGYKELTIPPGDNGSFQIEKNALHIWPRGGYMLIALPNNDGSFTCTLFNWLQGKYGFDNLTSPIDVNGFFNKQFPDTVPLMPTLEQDFFSNPTGTLITIKCSPWHVKGKALLLGDSAHAIVPFYGQGMNCAFEDCSILDECIDEAGDDWETVYARYFERRKADADAIADLALENFIEMRDSVANPVYQRKKKLELRLERAFPGQFYSKYAMVTFHRIPYAEAMEKGNRQDKKLLEICAEVSDVDLLDIMEIKKTLADYLSSFS